MKRIQGFSYRLDSGIQLQIQGGKGRVKQDIDFLRFEKLCDFQRARLFLKGKALDLYTSFIFAFWPHPYLLSRKTCEQEKTPRKNLQNFRFLISQTSTVNMYGIRDSNWANKIKFACSCDSSSPAKNLGQIFGFSSFFLSKIGTRERESNDPNYKVKGPVVKISYEPRQGLIWHWLLFIYI